MKSFLPKSGLLSFLLLITTFFLAQQTFSQGTMGRWETCGLSGITGGNVPAAVIGANLTFSALSRGNGITATSATNGYSSSGFSTSNTLTIANNDYYEFTITPTAGFPMSIGAIKIRDQVSSTTANGFDAYLRYSVDGFANNLSTWNPSTSATNRTIDLGGVAALQNRTTAVTFRIYGADAAATGTTYRIDCQGTAAGNFRGIDVDGTYKSQIISVNTGAATWCPGETRSVTATIKNIGTAPWTDVPGGNDFSIGVKWNTDVSQTPDSWTDYHVRVDAGNLAPGATGTYTFSVTASNATAGPVYSTPLSAGTNNLTFDVVYEGVSWFGDNNGVVGPGNAKFISPNITISALPQGTLSGNTKCSGGTGQLTFTSTAGTSPFTVVYNDGVANRTVTNVSSGIAFNTFTNPASTSNYTLVSVTSTTGCSRTSGFTDGSATITVNTAPSISVQPVAQTKCAGQSVTFSVTASGTSSTYQWRKGTTNIAGATASSYTIASVAAGDAANYNVVVSVANCSSITSSNAALNVNTRPTGTITSGNIAQCNGGSTNITGTVNASGAWTLVLSSGGGTLSGTGNGTFSKIVSPTAATTYTIASLSDANCTSLAGDLAGSTTVTVNPFPGSVTASPASSTICLGSTTPLTASATLPGSSALIIDDFDGASTFTAAGSSAGNRSQLFQQEISGANVNSLATFTSPGGGNLMVSTAGSGNFLSASSSANSTLTSGIINTTGFSSLTTLTFDHTYRDGNSSGTGLVEVSTNGGTSWTTLTTYNANVGNAANFVSQSINFAAYANMTNLKIRFNFTTANILLGSSWWAIDDVVLNGVRIPLYSWTANTAPGVNGLPSGSGNPSISNANISVKPTSTTTYTLTAANPVTGCSAISTSVLVTVNPAPSLNTLQDASLNTSADGTGNCSAAYSWTHPAVNTSCPTTLKVTYTAGSPAPSSLPAGATVTVGGAASATFFTGVTNVTYTATDQNNNTATTSFTVTVADNEAPSITCSGDVTVNNATGQCNATVTLSNPVTSDNCGVASVTNDHPSNTYPVGTTDVTWTVTDNSNNINTCTQKVTVKDAQLPTITCNADVNVNNDNGQCSATVTLTAPGTDDNCGVASVTNDHSSSDIFPVGVTIVKWTVTDNAGNVATCNQSVTVTDNENPIITCPGSITTVTDADASFATITLTAPTVNDNCGVSSTVNDHPSTQFPIGPTLVKWTVTDIHGNINTCLQTVLVNDIIDPSISCNLPIAINNTTGECEGSTNVTYPAASDNSGHVTVSSDYAGLSIPSVDPLTPKLVTDVIFPVGLTTIIWTAVDPSLNDSWCTQTVTVIDNERPKITCLSDITQPNDAGLCSAVITLTTPATSDNCGVLSVTNDHPSNVFTVGETIVTWTVTDIHNNVNTCTQQVTITDEEAPTIGTATNVNVNTDNGQCSAGVTLTAPSTGDNCGVENVTNNFTAESFPVGTTIVKWTVADIHGNTNSSTQSVTVTDNELPVISASSNITQTADAGKCGAAITIVSATATDNCGIGAAIGTRSDALALSAPYPVGTTTITWTVSDIHGNAAEPVMQTVIVTDDENPVISSSANISVNNDAGLCGASVAITPATAADNCGVGATTGTRSDALALNAPYPVGTTTINWMVTDIHGNVAAAVTQTVTVTDNEIPVITSSPDINVINDLGVCGATLSITPLTATDNCGVGATAGTRSDGLALTDFYPVGVTSITWTVSDIHGNAALAVTQTITITDNELPVITASADISKTADAGQCGAAIAIADATATDNCGVGVPTGTRSDGQELKDAYPVGITTITWTANDIHGNSAVAVIQTITVTDNEKPVIYAGDNITKTADQGVCGAEIIINPAIGTDNCGVGTTTGTRSDGLAISALYPVGTTTITWTVTDIHGNAATQVMQIVTITDDELPVIASSGDISMNNDPGQCGASVALTTATATDNCTVGEPTGIRSDALALTAAYPVGITTITWTVTDIHGNPANAVTQSVTVTDNELPVITPAANISVNNDAGKCGATVAIVNATATDNCGVGATTGTRSDALSLTALYPVGTTTITWTVTDVHGNAAINKTQTVTVADNEKPKIVTCASSVTVIPNNANCTSLLLDYRSAITATDNCTNPVTLTQSPVAGSALAVGANTITITATDASGNSTTCNFTVTVNKNLDVTVSNSNPQLYYGYSLDQSTVIKGTAPTIGAAPYKIVITMNRILGCNAVTSTGDEIWTASTGGTTTGNTCPTAGTAASIPVSTMSNIAAGGSYSVTATLMSNAIFTVTITDKYGCTVSKTTDVHSEDDRCFVAGQGNGATKFKICHRTGNANDPCHELCVAESAVAAHLAHGDFMGSCTPNCIAPPRLRPTEIPLVDRLTVKVMPNPSKDYFTVLVNSPKDEKVNIKIMDLTGRLMEIKRGVLPNGTIQLGKQYRPGTYFAEVIQGKERITLKLLKMYR